MGSRFDSDVKIGDNIALRFGNGTDELDPSVSDVKMYFDGQSFVSSPFNPDASLGYAVFEDFRGIAGATEPPYITTNVQTAATVDYVTGFGTGLYAVSLTNNDAADAGQILCDEVDITTGPVFDFKARLDGLPLLAVERFVIGLASAHANAEDALDDVATNAWFRVEGTSLNLLWETDDGTTDDDDNDTGIDLVDDTFFEGRIDFRDLTAVKFYVKVSGTWTLVGTGDMTDATGVVRVIYCIQRTDNSGTEAQRDLETDYYGIFSATAR